MYKKLNKSYKTKPKHRRLKRKSLKKKWMKWIGGQEGDDDDFPGAEMSVRKPDVILKDLQKEDEKAKEVRNKINELMEKKNEMNGDAYEEGMDKLMNDATAVKENVDKLVEEMEDPRVGAITDQLQDAERIQNIADKIVKIGADIRVKPAEVIGQPTSFDDLALKPAKVVSSTSPLGNDNYQAPGEPAAAAASTFSTPPLIEPPEPAEPATSAMATKVPILKDETSNKPVEAAAAATISTPASTTQFQQIQSADVLINSFQELIDEINATDTTGDNKDVFMKPIVEVISHLEKIEEILRSNVSRRDKVKQIAALKSYEKCGTFKSRAESGMMSAFDSSLVKRYRDSCEKMQEYVGKVMEQLNKPEPKPEQAEAAASAVPESKKIEPTPTPVSVQPKDETDAVEAVPMPIAQAEAVDTSAPEVEVAQTSTQSQAQAETETETASTSMQLTLNPQEMIQMLDGYKNKISELQSKLQKISQDGDVSINIKQGATDMSAETKEMMNNLLPFLALF